MFVDDWGHEYKTKEEAIAGVLPHMDVDLLSDELGYYLNFTNLFKWIWKDPRRKAEFEKDFAEQLTEAQTSWAEWCFNEEED